MAYLASFDIAGAFDYAPHRRLVQAMSNMKVDGHMRRLALPREDEIRYGNSPLPKPCHYSWTPAGGSDPAPALAYMSNAGLEKMREMREEMGASQEHYADLLHADDITCVVLAGGEETLKKRHMLLKKNSKKVRDF